jgi:taurine dioxygenase
MGGADQGCWYQHILTPRASHPIVRTHPVTGRRALFVNRYFATHINGLPSEERRTSLDYLYGHSTREELQVRFRCLPHYYPQTRSGRRVTIKGDRPF